MKTILLAGAAVLSLGLGVASAETRMSSGQDTMGRHYTIAMDNANQAVTKAGSEKAGAAPSARPRWQDYTYAGGG